MAFKTRQGTEAQRLLLSGTSTPASGEPLWTTDYKQYYVGDGTAAGGIWIGPGTRSGTSVVFDNITCTTLTTTGASVHTTNIHASSGVTSHTLHIGVPGGTGSSVYFHDGTAYSHSFLYTSGLPGFLTSSNLFVNGTLTAGTAIKSNGAVSATSFYSGSVNLSSLISGATGVHSGLTGLLNNDHPQYRLTANTIPATQITTGLFAGTAVDFWFPRNVYCDSVVCKGDNVYLNSGVTQSSGGIWVITGSAAAGNGFYYVTGTSTWTAGQQMKVLGTLTATTISGSAFVSGSSDLSSVFASSAHTHVASAITSGTFGTGAFTFPGSVSATTYFGITGPMIHGGSAYTMSAAQLGTGTGDSMFRVSNHFFVDNSFGNYNATIYYQNTGATKWALDLDKTTENLQMYRLGGTGKFKVTAGDVEFLGATQLNTLTVTGASALASVTATSVSATTVTGGTVRSINDVIVGKELYINYSGGGVSRFWMHNGTTFSGANISFNAGQFEISHAANFGGAYIATDGGAAGYDLYLNTNTSNTSRIWFGHVGASYNAHSLSYDTGTSRFRFSGAGLTVDGAISASSLTAASLFCGSTQVYPLTLADYKNLTGITYASNEPTGFINTNKDSTLGFTASSRTLGITPTGSTFDVMVNGTLYQKTGETVQISNVYGLHRIVYTSAGTLTDLGTGTTIQQFMYDNAFVAEVMWNTGTSVSAVTVGDERHGIMDPIMHEYLHLTNGTVYISGLAPSGITADGAAGSGDDSYAVIGFGSGTYKDEDLQHSAATVATGSTIPVLYMSGTNAEWHRATARIHPIFTGTGSMACYNQNVSATTWQMTPVTSTNFVLYHFFGTNDITNKIVAIPGQAQYSTIALARAGANTEMNNLQIGTLPTSEYIPIASVIYEVRSTYTSNQSRARIRTTDIGGTYVDWRRAKVSPSLPASNHGTLAGLSNDDHPQYLTEARLTGASHTLISANTLWASTYSGITLSKGVSILTPTSAETLTLMYTSRDITFTTARAVVVGSSPSVTITGWYDVDRNSGGPNQLMASTTVTGVTTGTSIAINTTVPAGNWVVLQTTATGGTVNEFHITMNYKEV